MAIFLSCFSQIFLLPPYKKVVLKTCAGCALANYPEVVKFLKYDLPSFDSSQLQTNYESGGDPRLVAIGHDNEIARVLDISALTLRQIRVVIKKLGFSPTSPLEETVLVDKRYLSDKLLEKSGRKKDIFNASLGIREGKIAGIETETLSFNQRQEAATDTSDISINSEGLIKKTSDSKNEDL